MSLVHNEHVKLTANWFDRASTASLTIGVIAPTVAAILGQPGPVPLPNLLVCVAFWLFAAVVLHFLGRRVLRRLQS